MTTSAIRERSRAVREEIRLRSARRPSHHQGETRGPVGAPIVAAVDGSAAGADAAPLAALMARELEAPLVFVYVRRGPSAALGDPYYQRRLDGELAAARRALEVARRAARREGVSADGEVLEGDPARRLVEFARHRRARLLVLGSRSRRFGRSVSRRVIRSAERPVAVVGASPSPPRRRDASTLGLTGVSALGVGVRLR